MIPRTGCWTERTEIEDARLVCAQARRRRVSARHFSASDARRILENVGDSAKRCGEVRIGISGWRYKLWRGVFYPKDLPQKCELEYAAGIFGSVEINGTFYSLQRPSSFARWADATPERR